MHGALPACVAVVLAAAAVHELGSGRRGPSARKVERFAAILERAGAKRFAQALLPVGLGARLERAGLAAKVTPAVFVTGKLAGLLLGGLLAVACAPAVPARTLPVMALALSAAGLLLPEALVERAARRRKALVLAALPDALDLLAVGVAAGRSADRVMKEIAAATSGPLTTELAIALAELECGTPRQAALDAVARRVPGPELAGVAAALERSRRYGSPLAGQLHDHAAALRREASRALEERAARAAPKIQLVVALMLVPSVLLMLLAALVAHAGALFPGA
jgi:tight adherence protein C